MPPCRVAQNAEPKVKEASVCLPRSLFSHLLETNEETTVDMQGRTLKLEKGGLLEMKSDPTQERSDPPISVAARVLIERRALITVVGCWQDKWDAPLQQQRFVP